MTETWFPSDLLLPTLLAVGILMVVIGGLLWIGEASADLVEAMVSYYDDHFVFVLQWRQITQDHVWTAVTFALVASVVVGAFFTSMAGWPMGVAVGLVTCFLLIAIPLAIASTLYELFRRSRGRKIDDVLPSVLQQLSANMKNKKNLGLAMEEVSRTAAAPMDYELRLLALKERDLGSISDALDEANRRMRSDWFLVTAAILKTTSRRSSVESEALQNLSRVFAQQKAMRDRIDTATRQGVASMKIMAAVPFFVVLIAPFFLDEATLELADLNVMWAMVITGLLIAFTAIGLAIWMRAQDV